jgi:hypothetical protein
MKISEAELRKAYRDRVPAEQLLPFEEARQAMQTAEERNAAALERARQRLFQRLYHEAFHAYVTACVYPSADGELPRWLNEGLAQIFETATVEAAELRVGYGDRERYDALRSSLKRGDLLPTAELLRSGPKQFVVVHASGQAISDRYYLASRALAFYLTFERHLPGTKRLDDYVHALHGGREPVAAFEELVGQSLAIFERDYRAYLERLRPNGTTGLGKR